MRIVIGRKATLRKKFNDELKNNLPDIEKLLTFVDEYEESNIITIDKLKRKKVLDLKKINGALKQTIDAHGNITKMLISSASKRIYGALLVPPKKNLLEKVKEFIRWMKDK
jgi:hypothetical protein